jgi:Cytochrome C oxidase, cbb3-type, subunit III
MSLSQSSAGQADIGTSSSPGTSAGLPHLLVIGGVVLVLVLIGAGIVFAWFQRDVPETHADIVDHFKYGSIGAEERAGVPYWIWKVLPSVFPEYLPDRPGQGYERLGFIYESATADRPIGTSLREKPVALVGLNCAVCHTGTVRQTPDVTPQIVLGMPAQGLNAEGYFRFLFAAARDPRFNADTLMSAIQRVNPNLPGYEGLVYRYLVIPNTKQQLLKAAQDFAWFDSRPDFGPGRVDTFNPYKVLLGIPIANDHTVGTADLPSLWDQRPREGMHLHWDGNNDSLDERNRSATIGAGATPDSLDDASLQRIREWILDLPPPRFPADTSDSRRVEAGRAIYQAQCAACHDVGAAKVGVVTPLAEIGTDPERLNSFTPELAAKMDTLGQGHPWQFSHFSKTDGYANMPLDGLWLRAPYLHNGSVPSLRDLLNAPAERPTVFYRGYDVYDYANVGFVSTGPEAQQAGFRFDTRVQGNGNGGHVYGTTLSSDEKNALLEYLKTL